MNAYQYEHEGITYEAKIDGDNRLPDGSRGWSNYDLIPLLQEIREKSDELDDHVKIHKYGGEAVAVVHKTKKFRLLTIVEIIKPVVPVVGGLYYIVVCPFPGLVIEYTNTPADRLFFKQHVGRVLEV